MARGYDLAAPEMYDPALLDLTADFLAVDNSADMIEQLRQKPGAEAIATTVGDFAETVVAGPFSLVYVVYNSISNLLEQAEWVHCFRNAARHLGPGGRFVIELWVPDLRRFPHGAVALPFDVSPTHVGFDTIDVATQRGESNHYFLGNGRVSRFVPPYRSGWPADRWADWDRSPFTNESGKHISVWERP